LRRKQTCTKNKGSGIKYQEEHKVSRIKYREEHKVSSIKYREEHKVSSIKYREEHKVSSIKYRDKSIECQVSRRKKYRVLSIEKKTKDKYIFRQPFALMIRFWLDIEGIIKSNDREISFSEKKQFVKNSGRKNFRKLFFKHENIDHLLDWHWVLNANPFHSFDAQNTFFHSNKVTVKLIITFIILRTYSWTTPT
jgi:hypothetical protein